jgi:hypothetical protein
MRMANALCRAVEMAEGRPPLVPARPDSDGASIRQRINE